MSHQYINSLGPLSPFVNAVVICGNTQPSSLVNVIQRYFSMPLSHGTTQNTTVYYGDNGSRQVGRCFCQTDASHRDLVQDTAGCCKESNTCL